MKGVAHGERNDLRELVFVAGHQRVVPGLADDPAQLAFGCRPHTRRIEQPQTLDLGRVERRAGQGDLPAHRTAAQVQTLNAQRLCQRAQALHLRGRRVVGVLRMRGFTEADVVGHDHPVVRRQVARHPREVVLVGAEAVKKHQCFTLREAGAQRSRHDDIASDP